MGRLRVFLGNIVAVAVVTAGVGRAEAEIIDQQNVGPTEHCMVFDLAYSENYGFGQSFTPGLSSLDFVRVMFSDQWFGDGHGQTWQVVIRKGDGFSGATVGTSEGAFPDGFGLLGPPTPSTPFTLDLLTPVQFDFASPVPLTPGSTYTMEFIPLSQEVTNVWWTTTSYAGGFPVDRVLESSEWIPPHWTVFHNYFCGTDYWFQEGVRASAVPEPNTVPEPSTLVLWSGLGAMGLIAVWRRRKRQAA